MYPLFRLVKEFIAHRNSPDLGLFDTHVSRHICWPHDIDVWMELNNGRTLTLYDLGRFVMFRRVGALALMRPRGWVGTVAGSSVRYRRRVRMFDRFEMRSRIIGWDARFLYVEQAMWRAGECTSHVLLRTAITGRAGLVPMAEVSAALGDDTVSPPLPAWVAAWTEAEGQRPWPPMQSTG